MKARRAGRCAICGGPVLVGTRIGRVAGRWSEIACIVAAQRAALGLRRPFPADGLRPL